MSSSEAALAQFHRLLTTARQAQSRLMFLSAVAVGGTAAALYAHHPVSLDVDFVTPFLRDRFDDVLAALEEMPGFIIARLRRPVLILGKVGDDEVGVRQLRRQEPLGAVQHEGLWIPSFSEMIRVKSFVLSDRRAVRDFVDVCALVETAGMEKAVAAMQSFGDLYKGFTAAGAVTAFAEAVHDEPTDAGEVDLAGWRMLKPEYCDLRRVRSVCERFALEVIENHASKRSRPSQ